jgi:SAM-dependent methyltransferase
MTYRPFNYDTPENQYAGHRRTDPRIAAYVHEALGDAQTIVNVGAGAGSYEPLDRYVFALEPSAAMRAQRPAGRPAIRGIAESIPVDDASVDAAMAMVTIHHWTNMAQGISEMKRVSRKRVVIMTFDPDRLDDFWNAHYFKEVIEVERSRYPTIDTITHLLGGQCRVQPVPIPLDCVDGFQEAFYGRPEAFLDKTSGQLSPPGAISRQNNRTSLSNASPMTWLPASGISSMGISGLNQLSPAPSD